jgi:hypothetical protein
MIHHRLSFPAPFHSSYLWVRIMIYITLSGRGVRVS